MLRDMLRSISGDAASAAQPRAGRHARTYRRPVPKVSQPSGGPGAANLDGAAPLLSPNSGLRRGETVRRPRQHRLVAGCDIPPLPRQGPLVFRAGARRSRADADVASREVGPRDSRHAGCGPDQFDWLAHNGLEIALKLPPRPCFNKSGRCASAELGGATINPGPAPAEAGLRCAPDSPATCCKVVYHLDLFLAGW